MAVEEEDMAALPEVEEEAMVAHPAAVVAEGEDTGVHPAAVAEEDTAELEEVKVDLLHPVEEEERRH